jgi:hypothetical protein
MMTCDQICSLALRIGAISSRLDRRPAKRKANGGNLPAGAL